MCQILRRAYFDSSILNPDIEYFRDKSNVNSIYKIIYNNNL